MNLMTARSFIVQDRMDWRKPHLRWISSRLYRPFAFLRER